MQEINTLFPLQNSWLLGFALLLAIVSIELSNKDKDTMAITGLFFAAFIY